MVALHDPSLLIEDLHHHLVCPVRLALHVLCITQQDLLPQTYLHTVMITVAMISRHSVMLHSSAITDVLHLPPLTANLLD